MRSLVKPFALLLIITGFCSILSCSSDNDNQEASPAQKKVVFKVVGSSNATIETVVYGLGTNTTPVIGINSASWSSSEILIPNNVNILTLSANGIGGSALSTLKLQIFVDNQLKKETTVGGAVMSTIIQYSW